MEVLSKSSLPSNKLSTRIESSTLLSILDIYTIDKSLMHYVNSPFDYSDTALSNGINNRISNVDHYFNCLFVERCFNHVLRALVYGSYITEDDLEIISITSAYRCYDLNKLVKGSKTSLHLCGLAIDVYSDLPRVLKAVSDYFVRWCNLDNATTIKGKLYPFEVIRYSSHRIHIGFKYIV